MADLDTLVAAIPTAQEGDVITINYHNTLRAAVAALASQPGGTGLPATVTVTFAPDLTPNDGQPPWSRQQGIAVKPGASAAPPFSGVEATGWMALQLPDGYRIDRLTISGAKTGNVGSWTASLIRQPMAASGAITVVSGTLDDAPTDTAGNFQVSQQATTTSTLIDNTAFKYVLLIRIRGADSAATATLFAFQVVCSKSQRLVLL